MTGRILNKQNIVPFLLHMFSFLFLFFTNLQSKVSISKPCDVILHFLDVSQPTIDSDLGGFDAHGADERPQQAASKGEPQGHEGQCRGVELKGHGNLRWIPIGPNVTRCLPRAFGCRANCLLQRAKARSAECSQFPFELPPEFCRFAHNWPLLQILPHRTVSTVPPSFARSGCGAVES